MLRRHADGEITPDVAPGEAVFAERPAFAGNGHRNGAAALAVVTAVPGHLSLVRAALQVGFVVHRGLPAGEGQDRPARQRGSGQQVRRHRQFHGALETLVGIGDQVEGLRPFPVVGRLHETVFPLRREFYVALIARLDLPVNLLIVKWIAQVPGQRRTDVQGGAARPERCRLDIQVQAGGDVGVIAPVPHRQRQDTFPDALRVPVVLAPQQVPGVVEHRAVVLDEAVGGKLGLPVQRDGVEGLGRAHEGGLPVQGNVILVAAEPFLGPEGPGELDGTPGGVVAHVHQRMPPDALADRLHGLAVADVEVTVQEDGAVGVHAAERLAAPEVQVAVQIHAAAVERIVGAFHVAAVEEDEFGAGQRAEVEPRLEADVPRQDAVAVAEGHLRLRDGGILRLAAQFRLAGIDEVDVAVVAHREVLDHQVVAPEIEHREIAHGALGLPAGGSQDHVPGVIRHAEQLQGLAAHHHPEGGAPADGAADLPVVRIVHLDRHLVPRRRDHERNARAAGQQGDHDGNADRKFNMLHFLFPYLFLVVCSLLRLRPSQWLSALSDSHFLELWGAEVEIPSVDSWVTGVIRSLANDVDRECLNLLLSFLPLHVCFSLGRTRGLSGVRKPSQAHREPILAFELPQVYHIGGECARGVGKIF